MRAFPSQHIAYSLALASKRNYVRTTPAGSPHSLPFIRPIFRISLRNHKRTHDMQDLCDNRKCSSSSREIRSPFRTVRAAPTLSQRESGWFWKLLGGNNVVKRMRIIFALSTVSLPKSTMRKRFVPQSFCSRILTLRFIYICLMRQCY